MEFKGLCASVIQVELFDRFARCESSTGKFYLILQTCVPPPLFSMVMYKSMLEQMHLYNTASHDVHVNFKHY